MAGRQERIDAFIHEGSPPADQPLEIYAKITSVRTSFRFYTNGPRALGKTRKHSDVSKLR